jgi:hypothetical protein
MGNLQFFYCFVNVSVVGNVGSLGCVMPFEGNLADIHISLLPINK